MPGNNRTNEMIPPIVVAGSPLQPSAATEAKGQGPLLFSDPISRQVYHGKNYLILIAIDNYNEETTGCKPLKNPIRDATRLREVLMQRYQYAALNEGFSTFLTGTRIKDNTPYENNHKVYSDTFINCLFNEDATKDRILEVVQDTIKSMSNEDQLLIFFSGHGKGGSSMGLLPFDYDFKKSTTKIAVDDLVNVEETVGTEDVLVNHFKSILLIVDACYAGQGVIGLFNTTKGETGAKELLFPCSYDEPTPDELLNYYNSEQGSPFSYVLCNFLKFNTSTETITAKDIPGLLNDEFRQVNSTSSNFRNRSIGHGPIAGSNNVLPNFCFYLKQGEEIPTSKLTESFITYLNFTEEKKYFEEDLVPAEVNKKYYFISSVSINIKPELLRWKIFTKYFLNAISYHDGDRRLYKSIYYKLDLLHVATIEDLVMALYKSQGKDDVAKMNLTDQLKAVLSQVIETLSSATSYNQPLIIHLIILNASKEKLSLVVRLLNHLIEIIEEATSTKSDTCFLFNIISNNEEIAEADIHYFNEEHLNEISIAANQTERTKLSFKNFNGIQKLNHPKVSKWFKNTKEQMNAKLLSEYLPKDNMEDFFKVDAKEDIDSFIERLVNKIYQNDILKRIEIFESLFFKNKS